MSKKQRLDIYVVGWLVGWFIGWLVGLLLLSRSLTIDEIWAELQGLRSEANTEVILDLSKGQ